MLACTLHGWDWAVLIVAFVIAIFWGMFVQSRWP